jgi:hydroxymethylpyrimidine pyrophosphatase-like HAD family hydrolase
MNAYRYNTENRLDRKYNNCGMEKNPNAIKFYATNMVYADNYKFIYNEDGEVISECTLEVATIENVNLFDMANSFKSLTTYNNYIGAQIGAQMRDYTRFMNEAKKASDKKMWANQIEQLKNREQELISNLFANEFQPLSDFEIQNELVAELKALGFDGYTTKNEIAII